MYMGYANIDNAFELSQWYKDNYYMVILSAIVNHKPTLFRIFRIFPQIVWYLILLSTIIVTLIITITTETKSKLKIFKKT